MCCQLADSLGQDHREIALHIEGMREDGKPIPNPTTQVAYADVA